MQEERVQTVEVAELLGQFACKYKQVECQQNAQTHVCWNIQLASDRIAAHDEDFQIDEFAELLGQVSCKKVKMSADSACTMGSTTLTVDAHVVQEELLELGKDCHVRCNGPIHFVAPQIKLFEFCERRK